MTQLHSPSQHLVGDFPVVVDLEAAHSEFGPGEVDAVAGNLAPVHLAGVLCEVVLLNHLVDDLVAEHVVPLVLELVEEAGGVVLPWLALPLLAAVDLHVPLVLGHQFRHLLPAVGYLAHHRLRLQLLPRVVESVLLDNLLLCNGQHPLSIIIPNSSKASRQGGRTQTPKVAAFGNVLRYWSH